MIRPCDPPGAGKAKAAVANPVHSLRTEQGLMLDAGYWILDAKV